VSAHLLHIDRIGHAWVQGTVFGYMQEIKGKQKKKRSLAIYILYMLDYICSLQI